MTCPNIQKLTDHPRAWYAGHFRPRMAMGTRFDPRNINKQCAGCNVYNDGRPYEHSLAIDKKFGKWLFIGEVFSSGMKKRRCRPASCFCYKGGLRLTRLPVHQQRTAPQGSLSNLAGGFPTKLARRSNGLVSAAPRSPHGAGRSPVGETTEYHTLPSFLGRARLKSELFSNLSSYGVSLHRHFRKPFCG